MQYNRTDVVHTVTVNDNLLVKNGCFSQCSFSIMQLA